MVKKKKNVEVINRERLIPIKGFFYYSVAFFTILVSSIVLIGWVLDIRNVLSLIPGAPTMKFNTALCFLILGLSLILPLKKNVSTYALKNILNGALILVGLATLVEYFLDINLFIDNVLVIDKYSSNTPGRMSMATAVCFLTLGLLNLKFEKYNVHIERTNKILFSIVFSLSLISAVSFIIKIPFTERMNFFETMAIHTSLLFFINMLILTPVYFKELMLGPKIESKQSKVLIPFIFLVVLVPLIIGFGIFFFAEKGTFNVYFGIIIFVVIFIVLSIFYASLVSARLNEIKLKRDKIEEEYRMKVRELENFKFAIESSVIVATTDAQGKIDYVNEKFRQISQYSDDELIGKTHSVVNSSYHDKAFFVDLWKTISKGNTWSGEIKNKAKDGSYYWVHTTIVPFVNKKGHIEKYMAVRIDITEEKKHEDQLLENSIALATKNNKLLELNRDMETFSYTVSHDLKAPLRALQGFSSNLIKKYGGELDETGQRWLEYIENNAKQMNQLIYDILEYSRNGKHQLSKTNVNCKELINLVIRAQQESYKTVAEFTVNDMPTIFSDPIILKLIWQNLIGNALKYSSKIDRAKIQISYEDIGDFHKFSITDNGIGFDMKYYDKLFGVFQRLHNNSEYEGTGVGLANVKKAIEKHGGEIMAYSEIGKGATFSFTIPKN